MCKAHPGRQGHSSSVGGNGIASSTLSRPSETRLFPLPLKKASFWGRSVEHMRTKCLLFAASLIASLGPLNASANSEATTTADGAPAVVEDRTQAADSRLEEVVVVSTKLAGPLSQTTNAVSVLTTEEIRDRQTTDLYEQLREVPGFSVNQTGARGGATTIFSRGGESDYNLVMIDGIKANQAGGAFNFSDLATVGIDRVEIVRGSQTALYGSEAISSVIQLFTPRGRGAPSAFLRFRGGNHGTFEEQLGFSGGTNAYGYHLSFERSDTEGILKTNSDFSNTTIASRFDFAPSEKLELTTTLRYNDSRFHHPTGGAGDRFDPLDPNQYLDLRRLMIGPRVLYEPFTWWRHKLQLGLVNEWRTFRDPEDGFGIDPYGSFVSTAGERRISADYSSDLFLPSLLGILPTWTVGLYVEDEQLTQRSDSAGLRERVSPSRNAQSLYSQLLLQWSEMLFVTSGFRLDDGSTYGTHVNPRVSAAFILPGLKTKFRGGFSKGLKAPSFVDNFGTGSTFYQGNPDLSPEESTSWEIGVDQPVEFQALSAELNVTYFSTEFRDMIAFVFREGPDFLNVQRARSRGVEFGGRLYFSHGISARGSYTFLETQVLDSGGVGGAAFVDGKSLIRRPEHVGSLTFNYTYNDLNTNFHIFFKGRVRDLDYSRGFSSRRVRLQGYVRSDLALSYVLFRDRWNIRSFALEGQAKNIFDQNYEEVYGFSSAGATFLVGFRADF